MSNSVAVVTSGDAAPDAVQAFRDRQDWPGIHAWALCREFVEQIVGEAQAAHTSRNPGSPPPEVDWEPIWLAGSGAASKEAAIGRVVRSASEVAARIARPTLEAPGAGAAGIGPPSTAGDRYPAQEPVTVFVRPEAAAAAPAAVVEPVTAPVQPETPEPPVANGVGAFAQSAVDQSAPAQPHAEFADEPLKALVEPVAVPEPIRGAVPQATVMATGVMAPVTPWETKVGAPHEAPPVSQVDKASRRRAGWVTTFTWIETLGVVILLFVAWQLWGTAIAQHRAQDQLHAEFNAKLRADHVAKAGKGGPVLVAAATRLPSPPDGSVVAHLQIPAISVDQYVVEGTTENDLSIGPGHYVGTAQPGQAGNVAIAGHRTTHGAPFNRLGQLVKGDQIILTTTSGESFTYVVAGTPQAVSPGDVSVLNYFGDNRITLTTCNPEFSSTQRLVAVGLLKLPSTVAPAPPVRDITYHITNPATASWDWSLLPAALIEICLLVLLGLCYGQMGRWFGRAGKWFILVPLWAAGLYLLFGTLTSFLPSSV
ncbi:MAG TPA: class E sortase [Acidimicrobiales bacterium]|nr:class E sortase [Acidimicrobiales bacterium]